MSQEQRKFDAKSQNEQKFCLRRQSKQKKLSPAIALFDIKLTAALKDGHGEAAKVTQDF